MENLINSIIGDATTFEPRALIGIIVFVLINESLCRLLGNLVKGVQR